jgi:putative protease
MKQLVYRVESLGQKFSDAVPMIGFFETSRKGTFGFEDLPEVIDKLGGNEYIILEFDTLPNLEQLESFKVLINELNVYQKKIRIRVQDLGVAELFFKDGHFDLELNLETGHHNWDAIHGHVKYFGEKLKKVILSYELSFDELKKFSSELKKLEIESELMIIGEILLFYSPRKLLTRIEALDLSESKFVNSVRADSLESAHKNFRIDENKHGSFMYHPKVLDLSSRIELLNQTNLTHYRLDLNLSHKLIGELIQGVNEAQNLKLDLDRETTRGYFENNKSDVLFKKLKNKYSNRTEQYIGKVISIKKKSFLMIKIDGEFELKQDQLVSFLSTEGKVREIKVSLIRDLEKAQIPGAKPGKIVLLDYVSGFGPGSIIELTS